MRILLVAAGLTALLLLFIHAVPVTARVVDRTWDTPYPLAQDGPKCVGFALETWELSGPHPATYPVKADFIYEKAQYYDGGALPHDGTTIEAGIRVLQDYGRVSAVEYSTDTLKIRNFLLDDGPVVFVSLWHKSMDEPAPDGYAVPWGPDRGWHAYECNQWTDSGRDGQSFGCINSWGGVWNPAYRGHFKLHLRDVQTLIDEGGYAALITKAPGDLIWSPFSMWTRHQ